MIDKAKVIKGLEYCIDANGKNCPMACPFFQKCFSCFESTEPFYPIMRAALELLKEQEVRELTVDEWREWKNNPKRDPICMLWENDTSPMWILKPTDVHEPALLMGKLKLFTGKPTFEQCKAVKWR